MLGVPTGTLIVIGLIGGVGASATYVSYHVGEEIGHELTPQDLLPLPPPYLPIPRFIYTKPHLVERLKKKVNGG